MLEAGARLRSTTASTFDTVKWDKTKTETHRINAVFEDNMLESVQSFDRYGSFTTVKVSDNYRKQLVHRDNMITESAELATINDKLKVEIEKLTHRLKYSIKFHKNTKVEHVEGFSYSTMLIIYFIGVFIGYFIIS